MFQISTMSDPYPVILCSNPSPARCQLLQSPLLSFPHRPSAAESSTCPRTSWRRLAFEPNGVQQEPAPDNLQEDEHQRPTIRGQLIVISDAYLPPETPGVTHPTYRTLYTHALFYYACVVHSPLGTSAWTSLRYRNVLMKMTTQFDSRQPLQLSDARH